MNKLAERKLERVCPHCHKPIESGKTIRGGRFLGTDERVMVHDSCYPEFIDELKRTYPDMEVIEPIPINPSINDPHTCHWCGGKEDLIDLPVGKAGKTGIVGYLHACPQCRKWEGISLTLEVLR